MQEDTGTRRTSLDPESPLFPAAAGSDARGYQPIHRIQIPDRHSKHPAALLRCFGEQDRRVQWFASNKLMYLCGETLQSFVLFVLFLARVCKLARVFATVAPRAIAMQRTVQHVCQLATPALRSQLPGSPAADCAAALACERAVAPCRHFAAVPSYQEATASQQAATSAPFTSSREPQSVRASDAASGSDLPEYTAGTLLVDTLSVMKCDLAPVPPLCNMLRQQWRALHYGPYVHVGHACTMHIHLHAHVCALQTLPSAVLVTSTGHLLTDIHVIMLSCCTPP